MSTKHSKNKSKRSYKLLIVDDDKFISDMYVLKLERAGHKPVATVSVDDALQKLRENNDYDAIVTDLIMPKKDGFEFLEEASREHLLGNSVVLILSNQDGPDISEKAEKLGVSARIVKAHALPNEVLRMLECAIEKHKYGEETDECKHLNYTQHE